MQIHYCLKCPAPIKSNWESAQNRNRKKWCGLSHQKSLVPDGGCQLRDFVCALEIYRNLLPILVDILHQVLHLAAKEFTELINIVGYGAVATRIDHFG